MRIHEITQSPAARIIQHLKTTCSHTWQAFTETNRPLVRGSSSIGINGDYGEESYSTEIRRKNIEQKKATTGPRVTEVINNFLISKFKYPFRYGMFATTRQVSARLYGPFSVIFPHNNFVFCFSEKSTDLWAQTDDFAKVIERNPSKILRIKPSLEKVEKAKEQLISTLEEFDFKAGMSSNIELLKQAFNSEHEIMIYPIQGIQIPYTWINVDYFNKYIMNFTM